MREISAQCPMKSFIQSRCILAQIRKAGEQGFTILDLMALLVVACLFVSALPIFLNPPVTESNATYRGGVALWLRLR